MPNNQKQNLILAEYAVTYVQSVISRGLGPNNRSESVVHRLTAPMPPRPEAGPSPRPKVREKIGGTAWQNKQRREVAARRQWENSLNQRVASKTADIMTEVERQRAELAPLSRALHAGRLDNDAREEAAIMIGGQIQKTGLGNCGEQSCVAFKYLITRGATGLAIVNWQGGNHTFVVVGMDASTPKISEATLQIPPVWGAAAVVCDPWYHEWFVVDSMTDWQSKMKRILKDTLQARPDGLEKIAAQAQGTTQAYAKNMTQKWKFDRMAYLPHNTPRLTHLACALGVETPTLRAGRAPNFTGWRP